MFMPTLMSVMKFWRNSLVNLHAIIPLCALFPMKAYSRYNNVITSHFTTIDTKPRFKSGASHKGSKIFSIKSTKDLCHFFSKSSCRKDMIPQRNLTTHRPQKMRCEILKHIQKNRM